MNAEDVVRAEIKAWSTRDVDQIMAYFAEDATFFPGFGSPTYSGFEEIRRFVEDTFNVITRCDFEIVNLAVADNVVLTERVDRIVYDGKPLDLSGMGVFEVAGDKITAWRDYFYMSLAE